MHNMEARHARSDQTRNYCYNIKAYHEKQGEEQFYDFTIKGKDGAEIHSHKFILASQRPEWQNSEIPAM